MNFISINFVILLFSTLVVYYFVGFLNSKLKNKIPQWSILLIGSLIFYLFANYIYLVYLLVSFLVSYICALITKPKSKETNRESFDGYYDVFDDDNTNKNISEKKSSKAPLVISILINVGILSFLKYFNFFSNSINSLFKTNIPLLNLIIPIGISFYTFSLISYNVDVYKGDTIAERNPLKLLLFVSYFPKLLQGPISSYETMVSNGLFKEHKFLDNDYSKSFLRIAIGFAKKAVIADVLGLYVNEIYSHIQESSSLSIFLATVCYSIQLYCDFSGFLDMSIGISGLFGIKLEENFKTPYLSSSIREFWGRWHITLGAWLKKYIYIPLGGNRVSVFRWIINTLIVWLISGIWHGANWTFIIWGLLHGVLLVIEGLPKQIRKVKGIKEKPANSNKFIKAFKICVTFLLVNLGWIFFRSNSISESFEVIKHILSFNNSESYNVFSGSLLSGNEWLYVLCPIVIFALIIYIIVVKRIDFSLLKVKLPLRIILIVAFISLSIFMTYYLKSMNGGESSFIYFDF